MEDLKFWLKKYYPYILLFGIALIVGITLRQSIIKMFSWGSNEDEAKKVAKDSNSIQKKYGIGDEQMKKYNDRALSIAKNFGTHYAPFNPLSWTENDKQAYYDLKSLKEHDFKVIEELYNTIYVYDKTRRLIVDIKNLLDKQYFVLLKTQVTWIS